MNLEIPTLETKRLRLRAHQISDLDLCIEMWKNPIVNQFISPTPSTRQQTWSRMLGYLGHWALMGFGYWAIEEKRSKLYIGEVGFADFKRDMIPPIESPEAGWAVRPQFHGQGLATEAIQEIIKWGAKHLNVAQTTCMIHPDNKASIRVAQKCGFVETHRATYKNEPTIVMIRNFN